MLLEADNKVAIDRPERLNYLVISKMLYNCRLKTASLIMLVTLTT